MEMKPISNVNINSFSGQLPELNIIPKSDDELQRTKEWHEKRRGRFTGSKISDLMVCDRSASKKPWGDASKYIAFGEGALKYIFEKAMERKTGKVIQISETWQMRYGTNSEPIVKSMLDFDVKEVGFIEFIEGVAGSSPDGLLESKDIGVEIKCVTNWGSFYNRTCKPFDQSHEDFWQVHAEMLSLNVKSLKYIVAEPPENIFEPVINDLNIQDISASPIHQNSIKIRCYIGDAIIKEFLSGIPFHSAVNKVCSDFDLKEFENKLI